MMFLAVYSVELYISRREVVFYSVDTRADLVET